jgi:HEAT repeat protein
MLGPRPVGAAGPAEGTADELTLRAAGLPADGPGVLEFFRRRAGPAPGREQTEALVRQLADAEPARRDRAAAELVGTGPAAVPWLRRAAKDPDAAATAQAARRCLQALEPPQAAEVVAAAARRLARRPPPGTIPVLVAYLPFADGNAALDEVKAALLAAASRAGAPDAALVAALEDPLALRRAVAAEVLCEAGAGEPRAGLRRLLDDPRPLVRLRAGLALANLREPQAVSTLIALLTELPPAHAKQAAEYLIALAADQAPKAALGETAGSRQACRDAWAAWWKATEGPGLLDEVRKRTLRPDDGAKVVALVRQLGDDAFEAREQAQAALRQLGTAALPALRQAARDPDVEVSTRSRQLLAHLEKDPAASLAPTTVRLVGYRKPPGAAEALLAYLPCTEDEGLQGEVQESLSALAFAAGPADPALVKALADPAPLVRGAAAEALCQGDPAAAYPLVRPLLQDPDVTVRQRAALALAAARDREAVPVLIALLGELPPERSAPAEDYLLTLAGDRAPSIPAGKEGEDRAKRAQAWSAWWADRGPQVELPAVNRFAARAVYHGYTVVTLPQSGQVIELGTDAKPRWQVSGLSNPFDAEVLPGQRVLVAEYGGNRVTERNLRGEVLWQKQVNLPLSAQRLPNGNTFIVTRNQLLEVDRGGKEVLSLGRNMHDVMAARKLRDGQIVLVTQSACLRLDSAGKEQKSFALPNGVGSHHIDIGPQGNVLIPMGWMNKVYEYDADGKTIAEVDTQQPMSAARLPNGHTLVASQVWPPKVIELDKSGKAVWEYQPPTQPGRVKRR